MTVAMSNGSPAARTKMTPSIHRDTDSPSTTSTGSSRRVPKDNRAGGENDMAVPAALMTSKLSNQSSQSPASVPSYKKQKTEHVVGGDENEEDVRAMDRLLAKLAEQEAILQIQQNSLNAAEDTRGVRLTLKTGKDLGSSTEGSVPITPATDAFSEADNDGSARLAGADADADADADAEEMHRLKRELEEARSKIARMDRELSQTRITKHSIDQVLASPIETEFRVPAPISDQTIGNLQGILNAATRGSRPTPRDSWTTFEEAPSVDATMPAPYGKSFGIWGNAAAGGAAHMGAPSVSGTVNMHARDPINGWGDGGVRLPPHHGNNGTGFAQRQPLPPATTMHPQHAPAPSLVSGPGFGRDGRGSMNAMMGMNAPGPYAGAQPARRSLPGPPRSGSIYNQGNMGWGMYSNEVNHPDNAGPPSPVWPPQSFGAAPPAYHGHQMSGTLSPTAPEFTAVAPHYNSWNGSNVSPGPTYVSPIEPLNYRRLLDRTVNCDWKYIVDKIVCNNDQQASIFLQQKLKMGTPDQKFEIVEAIVAQAYPLMVNRFGNFLVQRCFEHGSAEQVIAIANAIRGNTLNLSMDSFGCHVVQKAFDCVPEEYKAVMVHELLRRIPETVIHRYACHVWQKLFELRWSGSPPQIMKYVNEALRGMWHEVALGETGSLVVQNIFENCLEEDKRPCINEVLASIDIVSRGQFGNWCIQHICEHGMPVDRSRAIDHVLRHAAEYSMDQFASKVVEKCLRIGGPEFLERYLARVCEGRPDRPRIPLVDIASDQYGNYLIQYILTNANPQHREIVASHIRKHMVSLRGSKFGAKVGMLCCNPAYATRPGPGVGPYINRFPPGRFSGTYR